MGGQQEWKQVRGSLISTAPVLPGVWRRKESGHVVRGRVVDPRTGKTRELWKVLPEASATEAKALLEGACERIRCGKVEQVLVRDHLRDYSARLLERKVSEGDIRSQAGISKWREVLRRVGKFSLLDVYVDAVRPRDIMTWRSEMARRVKDGVYTPSTANTDLSVIKVILRHARLDFELSENPARDIPAFDSPQHRTYTREEPNSLKSSELREFLACMREKFPQHFAMVFAGFCTGLRPSTLRPLRRAGSTPDVLWDERVLLVRRSHTLGDVTMVGTKTGVDLEITVPEEPRGDATDVPGSLPRRSRGRRGDPLHLRARHRSDAAPLQHRERQRAGGRPRKGHPTVRCAFAITSHDEWGGKWGGCSDGANCRRSKALGGSVARAFQARVMERKKPMSLRHRLPSGRRDSNPRRPPWQDNPERFSAFRIVTNHEKIREI
jgi:hypothetical protein